METDCQTCQEIMGFEQALDERADALVERVNSLCADVRARNKQRWEDFVSQVNIPIIGGIIYWIFRAPKGLEPDPDYLKTDWYRSEGKAIEGKARGLEQMKARHIVHWGEERVEAAFGWDYAGYYEHCHPQSPMPRRDAYKEYEVEGRKERLWVFIPDKYDFSSAAGVDKEREGIFVLDSVSKKVVPLNQCDWTWTNLDATASNFLGRALVGLARSECIYTLRR